MARSKQGFQTGREVGGEKLEEKGQTCQERMREMKGERKGGKTEWCERRDKRASLLSDKAACILGFSALKQFFHVLPLLLAFLFICLSYPVHLLPIRGEALAAPHPSPSQFLSLFLSFNFFLFFE